MTAQARGLTPDDAYLFETAESAQRKEEQQRKKEKGRAAFGWDVFNQDSLFKAYKKRLAKLPTVRKGASVGLVGWARPCAYSPIPSYTLINSNDRWRPPRRRRTRTRTPWRTGARARGTRRGWTAWWRSWRSGRRVSSHGWWCVNIYVGCGGWLGLSCVPA